MAKHYLLAKKIDKGIAIWEILKNITLRWYLMPVTIQKVDPYYRVTFWRGCGDTDIAIFYMIGT